MSTNYRLGPKAQASLFRLNSVLENHPLPEFKQVVQTALAANLTAAVVSDQLGISYTTLFNWAAAGGDNKPSTLTKLSGDLALMRNALTLGLAMGLLPTDDGTKVAPTLALLVRALTLRNERDEARAAAAAATVNYSQFPADSETVASFDPQK